MGIEKFKVGGYGLESSTEGMFARTSSGILGKIINANEDEMINGPELKSNNRIYCVERDSIKLIKENIKDLIEAEDIVVYKIKGLENGTYIDIVKEIQDARTLTTKRRVKLYSLEQLNILQILTKEQFKANCYEVEMEDKQWLM